ncbi:atrial natriuretic peptide receptor 1-like [Mytilus trossulus]|uniref:atrial natriuretic peptide receptor 1-like n=1 Tax=Mytilus trossulus TaxID=6551 RepID=UPI0030068233
MERIGPAIDIAIERVNRDILNGSYQLVTIEKPYGKFCSGSTAPGIVADLVKDHAIIGLIGPACAYALDPTAKLANYWNIPIVTGFGDGGLFKNKTEYPTLTRLAYCQCRLRKVFGSIFIEFKWTNIAIIYDINDLHSRVLGTTLQTGLQKQQIFPKMFRYYGNQNTSYKDILLQVKKVSRVILLIVPGDSLREFMLDAFDLGFIQSGEYVFMDVWLFPFPGQYWGNHDWLRNDLRDQEAKLAYESLFRISLQVPTSVEWTNFTNDVKLLALSKYGFNFTNEEVNFFIGAFHDSVILFGMALNESLEAGSLTGNIDGYNFTRNMWNRIFNGITGQVIIDDNGDRDTSYSILDMDPVTGKFQVVADFFGDRQYYNPVPGKSVHWAGGRTAPPLNKPVCWYEGDNPECHISEKVDMYALIFSSMGVLLVVAFSVLFYRHKKHEQDILNDSWRVKYDDLEFNYNNVTASCYSMVSEKSSKHHQTGTASKNVANYMGKVLYVREVKKQKISITRKVLIEVQQVRSFHHENLSRFVGACVEPSHILILYEYYRKGTLEDLLYNDTITLDWTFRLSLLKDIAKGMKYLHSSALKYHGSLRSSNCVVDGRFVVKISDFGLPSFSDDIVMESEKSRKIYHST